MAESIKASPAPTTDPRMETINHLRDIAQKHLSFIDEDKLQEQRSEAKKLQDLERYVKHKRAEHTSPSPNDVSLPRMRSARGRLCSL
jgi:hypothetical protein